jgi:hypothetical protein
MSGASEVLMEVFMAEMVLEGFLGVAWGDTSDSRHGGFPVSWGIAAQYPASFLGNWLTSM